MPNASTTSIKDTANSKASPFPHQRDSGDEDRALKIPGTRPGWYYRPESLAILHRSGSDGPLIQVGTAPRVTGVVAHLTDDAQHIRIEYQVLGPRQRRKRIITEDEVERGTWAAKLGMPRPRGADARQAVAMVINIQADEADRIPARAYYAEDGELVFPDPEAQSFGYLVCEGTEENAREAWKEIGEFACEDPKAALVMGALFVGPVLSYLGVYAHILNMIGPGQQGKSTLLKVATAPLGTIKPKRQQLLITWNSSKQGITQSLRVRGFLPVALDEHSSAGRGVKESSREFSQIVAGCIRQMGTTDDSPRENTGFWHSTLLSSSNQPLKYTGQTEDLASRLHEISAPFFPHIWVNSEGHLAEPTDADAEHLSERLTRLATGAGGWPLTWAVKAGMFKTANLDKLKKLHKELVARHAPHTGGIPDTIAKHHMAWVVGAHMLEKTFGVEGLGAKAEQAAAERLSGAIEVAAQANLPEGVRLWDALDSLRIEASAYPPLDRVAKDAADGFRKVKGFTVPDKGEWWIVPDLVRDTAAAEGIENPEAALRQLYELGVHLRESAGNHLTKRLPRSLRDEKNLPSRMHCFSTDRAIELWAPDDDEASGTTSGTTGVVPENEPLTSSGTTGTTGTTISGFTPYTHQTEQVPITFEMDAIEDQEPTDTAVDRAIEALLSSADAVVVPSDRPGTAPDAAVDPAEARGASRYSAVLAPLASLTPDQIATLYPTPAMAVTDPDWDKLTRSAAAVGVLATDGLHLPNRVPVPMALPTSIDDLVPLMTAYGLQVLYLHQNVVEAQGLPTLRDRLAAKIPPGHGAEHEWATPAPDSPITAIFPPGLSEWMTLAVTTGSQDTTRLEVAIPAYETRFNNSVDDRGGFSGPEDGATLLETVMIWTLSTMETNEKTNRTRAFRYYRNPNRTGEDLAGGKGTKQAELLLCQAIRNKQVPPATLGGLLPKVAPRSWHRDLTPAERGHGWLHQYDKTAAWLAAYSTVEVGIGEPEHAPDGTDYNPKQAGFWRVADLPGHGLEGLPKLEFNNDPESTKEKYVPGVGHWLRTPGLELLREIYPDWTPEVVEAWYWPDTRRALYGLYNRVKNSRNYIVDAIEAERPGAKWAKTVNGTIYQSFWGYLQRTAGPKPDHETGGSYDRDIYWRPDWSGAFVELACANTYRNLMKFRDRDGKVLSPVTIHVDAVTFASDEPDPILAKPAQMTLGNRGGQWKLEGSAPMAELLPLVSDKTDVHKALNIYLAQGD